VCGSTPARLAPATAPVGNPAPPSSGKVVLTPPTEEVAQCQEDAETQATAQVEQPGQQQRRHTFDQGFCEGRAGAEQERGG